MAKEEKSAVEKLKNRLYARGNVGNEVSDERSPLSLSDDEAPKNWKDNTPEPVSTPAPQVLKVPVGFEQPEVVELTPTPEPITPKKHMSFATKFFLGSMVFFFGALLISAALFFGGINTTSPQNIDIQIVAPSLIDGGKQAELQVIITNRNTTSLELADLVIDYPDGARDPANPTQALTHQRISIGTINSGQQIKKPISAIFYGSEGVTETITAHLQYTVAGSNGVFEKQGSVNFTIGSSPVTLSVTAPSNVTAGDQFTLEVHVQSNAATAVENVAVEGQYPFGFSVSSAQPAAGAGGTIWRLGTLQPGSSKTIRINGTIEAADGDERVFRFLVGSQADQTDPHVAVPFLTVPQTLTVAKPFVTGSITLGGQGGSSVSVPAGKSLSGSVHWENNLPDAITGLELTLTISGPAVDKSTINSTNGFYQSSNSTIVWTSANDPALSSVPPGASGNYQFSFATLTPGSGGTLITNPTVTLSLSVRGTRQSDTGGTSVASAATMKAVLASALAITAQSFKTTGPFSNGGPVPPRAETPSTYTVTWAVKNSANTVANTTAQAVLPPYVQFVKGDNNISYDDSTRTVKWALGDVKAGEGYTSGGRQASFQVSMTPSTSQVGSTASLTGTVLVSGLDRFAQVQVQASAEGPTTATADGANGVIAPK